MYPVLLRIGSFEITSFGVMVAVGVLAALAIFSRELRRSGLDARLGADAAAIGVVGGLIGAKLLFVLEHFREPLHDTLLARGGLSWFGGLTGGLLAGVAALRRARMPLVRTLAAATPALAVGHAIGRIGCFLVGDDYGRPSSLPWAVAFPAGLPPTPVPVHPTQLYEAVGLRVLAWLLFRWRGGGVPDGDIIGRYLAGAGLLRFAVEFVRVNERVLLGLTVAHLFSAAALFAGIVLMLAGKSGVPRRSFPPEPGISDGPDERLQPRRSS